MENICDMMGAMAMAELKYWVWLATRKGITPRTACELLRRFGSAEAVYFAHEKEYKFISGDISSLRNKNLLEAKRIISYCTKNGIDIITVNDGNYPYRLKNITDPPILLYVKGVLPAVDDCAAVAVVGTRKCTSYGIKAAERISGEIASYGGVIVTGLAYGIDSAAAAGALRNGGSVIGVLGCGIDVVYPKENGPLFDNVLKRGALISEFAPGTPPEKQNFPQRNRIMSGLSAGVLVVEAPARSGALITASFALEQGRDVFAVPGNIDAYSCCGSNDLLKQGAIPVTCGADIIENYIDLFPDELSNASVVPTCVCDVNDVFENSSSGCAVIVQNDLKKEIDNEKSVDYIDIIVTRDELSPHELCVVEAMTEKSMHVDDIIEKTGMKASEVLAALTMLELTGGVIEEPGKFFTSHISVK